MSITAPWMLVSLAALLTLACSSASGGESGAPRGDVVCPSIAKQPHAELDLGDAALTQDGSYALEVEADGERETCEITVTGIGPAKTSGDVVESPSTRTSTTCTLVDVGGIQNDGSIRYLATAGTPKQLRVTLSFAGETRVSGTARPDYAPDECGFVEPIVTLSAE